MKKIKFIILSIFVIIHIVFIFAYAADIKNTPASVSTSSAPAIVQPQIQPQAQTEKTSDSTYSYYPLGKPDPFQPFVEVDIAIRKKQEQKVSAAYPLERDDIEKFRLAGIIGDRIQRLAIVEILDQGKLKFYPLLQGTHIGLHDGRVLEIMADRVIVEEHDKSKTRRIILKLHKEDEVKP